MCAVAGVVALLGLAAPAAAQLDLPPLLPSLPPPTLPSLPPLPLLTPPSPSPAPSQAVAPAGGSQPVPAPPQAPKDSESDYYPRCVRGVPTPPKLKRSAPGSTAALMRKAKPLLDMGLPADRVMAVMAPPFPVAGAAKFTDDWQMPRWTPCPHLHAGNDIFAAKGTPVVASGPGTIAAFGNHPVGGLSIWLAYDDRYSFFYTHLSGFAPGLTQGQRVERSTVIGFVGATGNAAGGSPHLHFEIHAPVVNRRGAVVASGVDAASGGLGHSRTPPVNPKPYLDQWLVQAEKQADGLVAEIVRRGGVLPTDAEAAEIVRSQSATLAEPAVFGLGKDVNRGILAIAVAFGASALLYSVTVLGRTRRMRPKPQPVPDLSAVSLYAARAAVTPAPPPEAALEPKRRRRRSG
jgi:murein DD-endopeptidase MepM/ murein hydrolase activator NlpD